MMDLLCVVPLIIMEYYSIRNLFAPKKFPDVESAKYLFFLKIKYTSNDEKMVSDEEVRQ